jgi:hypothetical protein
MMMFVLGAVTARTAAAESCTNNGDCKFGFCWSGTCNGTCDGNLDCKGYGLCSRGKCDGSCDGNVDCKVGLCSGGKCGSCVTNGDCHGGDCSSGHCSDSPFSTFGPFELQQDGTVVLAPWAAELATPANACSATAPASACS